MNLNCWIKNWFSNRFMKSVYTSPNLFLTIRNMVTTTICNKINTRSKSKETENQISTNNDAHLNAHLELIMLRWIQPIPRIKNRKINRGFIEWFFAIWRRITYVRLRFFWSISHHRKHACFPKKFITTLL